MQVGCDKFRWSMCEPFGKREVLIIAALEHLQKLQVGSASIFDVVRERFLDVADVARFEIHGAGAAPGGKNSHAALSGVEVLPLVGIWVPMKFANSTGLDRYDRGASRGYFECVRVDDADFPAFVALGGRKLHGAKSKIDRRRAKLSASDAVIFLKRAGNCGLKNEEFLLWHVCESLLADTKILRHDVRRCVRHPVGEKHGLVFGEVSVIKDK